MPIFIIMLYYFYSEQIEAHIYRAASEVVCRWLILIHSHCSQIHHFLSAPSALRLHCFCFLSRWKYRRDMPGDTIDCHFRYGCRPISRNISHGQGYCFSVYFSLLYRHFDLLKRLPLIGQHTHKLTLFELYAIIDYIHASRFRLTTVSLHFEHIADF